uniref:Uncharacterized protein n=1 Tax=Heterorhabditis bacteriophora TaxID=37862 RepID=A0A1I7X3B8_HETBA
MCPVLEINIESDVYVVRLETLPGSLSTKRITYLLTSQLLILVKHLLHRLLRNEISAFFSGECYVLSDFEKVLKDKIRPTVLKRVSSTDCNCT